VDPRLRVVIRLPLDELWRDDGFSTAARGKSLIEEDIRRLLHDGPVQFVVANVGSPLRWIPVNECFLFWKNDAKRHLATGRKAILDEFPGTYCYFASQWDSAESTPIVLLEMTH
jgi:hypothetical protein